VLFRGKRHGGRILIAALGDLAFREPSDVGGLAALTGHGFGTSRSSRKIQIDATGNDRLRGRRRACVGALAGLVSLGADMQPTTEPAVTIAMPEDSAHADAADERRSRGSARRRGACHRPTGRPADCTGTAHQRTLASA
jgi:acyl-CoA hydrolase